MVEVMFRVGDRTTPIVLVLNKIEYQDQTVVLGGTLRIPIRNLLNVREVNESKN